jgi:hypothetical protein
MQFLREHHIHTKTVGLITSNWYYRVGGWYGFKVQFLHNATIKHFIVESLFQTMTHSQLQEIEESLKNSGDLSEEVILDKDNFHMIFELQPETFSIGEGKENHTAAKVMEISCPGCILQQFRNLCIMALPLDNDTDPGKSLGYFASSNIGTIMDTQDEGKEAIKLQLRRHNRETENQQNIPLFYIPDLTLQVLDEQRNTVTLRDRLLQIANGITIFANNTDIPGHYKLIVKTDAQDTNLKPIRDKLDDYLSKLFEPRPTLYNPEWGLPTSYRYKPKRTELPQETDAMTIYRQKMKNQMQKYKKEEAQIVTLAQAKVLTQGKQVIHVGQNAWNKSPTAQSSSTNVLDLNNRTQVQKFITYFSEVTGLQSIKEEQQELKKALESRDQQLTERMAQQEADVKAVLEATKQNTQTIQANEQSFQKTIEDFAAGQKAIMSYLSRLAPSTPHDNTTITTQASTDISQLTPDPKVLNAHDSAAGNHDRREACGDAS